MSLDPLLPIAPARVRALLLPLGQITPDRFSAFVARLREEHIVHLRDITADGRPHRNMFSPLAYPDGIMMYDLSTHLPPPSHLALYPFDMYREPLVVVAIADGRELHARAPGRHYAEAVPGEGGPSIPEQNMRSLYQALEELRDDHAKALVHKVVLFDYRAGAAGAGTARDGAHEVPIPEGIATVPPEEESTRTTIKTVMCDLSSVLLAEMTSLAKSFEAMSHIESPGHAAVAGGMDSREPNGRPWPGEDGGLLRRFSQLPPMLTRSTSSSGVEKGHSRMSMPTVPFQPSSLPSTSGGGGGRPSTPVRSGLANPPTSFDDMSTAAAENGRTTPPEQVRPGTAESNMWPTPRDDKVSVQGFGPGSLSERLRNKGRERAAVVVGSLYLQAGRWTDALRELGEAANLARSINDHVWHGKALELVLVTVLLMGWAGLEFLVPPVLLPMQDKFNLANSSQIQEVDAAQPRHLQQLQGMVPDLLERILNLYSRVSAEHLPPLPMCETAVRFGKIFSAIHLARGKLAKPALDMMVSGRYPAAPPPCPRLSITPTKEYIIRQVFRAFPSSAPELLTTVDRVSILSGIASVLGPLGARRKKAMVMRELVSVLVTGLVEARTRGAAEVGIHPAAGLLALAGADAHKTSGLDLEDGDVEQGIDTFLGSLCAAYGIVGFDVARELVGADGATAATAAVTTAATAAVTTAATAAVTTAATAATAAVATAPADSAATVPAATAAAPSVITTAVAPSVTTTTTTTTTTITEEATTRIRGHSAARFFGFPEIKLDVLRACINFSEALPDFGGVLRFSSDLMRTAGSGVAAGTRKGYTWPAIPRDEQARLVKNIVHTSALAARLGPERLFAEYWDEFLVRGVGLEPTPPARMTVAQPRSALPNAAAAPVAAVAQKNPFIYNPFAQTDEDTVDRTLVVGEQAAFRVLLQNPFDVELEVESLRLRVEGAEFEFAPEAAVVGPYRTQIVRVWGTPRAAGAARVTAAVVKIRGCRERAFSVFPHAWAPQPEPKAKSTGLAALRRALTTGEVPACEELSFLVIPPQPLVVVRSTSLPQSSVMILEGERQTFSVTLRNLSTTTPADLLLFSFEDSTQEPLQAALKNRDATTAELYEYELILVKKQALRLRGGGGGDGDGDGDGGQEVGNKSIAPGASAVFEFEILGRPGLTSAAIRLSYGHLGASQDQHADHFHTRQLSVQLTVTVNASIELARLDVVAPSGPIPPAVRDRLGASDRDDEAGRAVADGNPQQCLLVLDLRNSFPSLMTVRLTSAPVLPSHCPPLASSSSSPSSPPSPAAQLPIALTATETILPGNSSRLVLPIPRVRIEDPYAPLPSLSPAVRQRQFVVSRSVSAEMERAAREAFWFREGLLRGVTCTWSCASGGSNVNVGADARRGGEVDLRIARLAPRMIEALRVEDVGVDVVVGSPGADSPAHSNSEVFVDDFVQIRVCLTNRTSRAIRPTVRLQPVLRHRPANVALDHVRKFAWNGTLQRVLGPVRGHGGRAELVIGATALCRGVFEIGVTVEEVVAPPPLPEAPIGEDGAGLDGVGGEGGMGAGEGAAVAGARAAAGAGVEVGRRMWHCRRPCVVVVKDGPAG